MNEGTAHTSGSLEVRKGPSSLAVFFVKLLGALVLVVAGLRFPGTSVSGVGVVAAFVVLAATANATPFASTRLPGAVAGLGVASAILIVASNLPAPSGTVFATLVFAVPLADVIVVAASRLRNRRPLLAPENDHLLHRLERAGLGPVRAAVFLVCLELVMAVLGVLCVRGTVPSGVSLLVGLALIVSVVLAAGQVRMYERVNERVNESDQSGFHPAIVWSAVALLIAVVALGVPAVIATFRARGPALAGERAADAALVAARQGHIGQASADFSVARAQFLRARSDLHAPLSSAGLAYPLLGPNFRAIRTLASVGADLAGQGHNLALTTDRFRYRVRGGTVPVAQLASTAPKFRAALKTIDAAESRLHNLDTPYLLAPVKAATTGLLNRLVPAKSSVQRGIGIAQNVPAMLGLNGERRYFLAFQTDAESRATGGLIGLNGVLVAENGHLKLTGLENTGLLNKGGSPTRTLSAPADYIARYGRFDPAYNWQMVNLSPNFPTVGQVIANLYPQSGGTPVDGVVAMDPQGLSCLLKLVGPVSVSGWPVPIDAANVSAITQNQAYIANFGSSTARQAFLENLVKTVFNKLTSLSLPDPNTLVSALAPAVRGGHILVYSTSPAREAYLATLGMTGAIPPVVSDALEITTQNASANKIDYYLHRTVRYDVHLSPARANNSSKGSSPNGSSPNGSSANGSPANGSHGLARVNARVSVSLQNTAPKTGLPPVVIGPSGPGFAPGENRTFFTLYTPLQFTNATLNGVPTALASQRELGRNADSTFINVQADSTATLSVGLVGTVRLVNGGWYELNLPSQPVINPDKVSVDLSVARGWRIGGLRGAVRSGAGGAIANFTMTSPRTVWVQVVRSSN